MKGVGPFSRRMRSVRWWSTSRAISLLRFAAHYQHLSALPRRMRRALERRWKCTLSAIALLMTLGQAPAFAAIMQVAPNTPPSIKADGKCSLIEAIVNANRNARPHLDCVAGAGAWTRSSCPQTASSDSTAQQMLPHDHVAHRDRRPPQHDFDGTRDRRA